MSEIVTNPQGVEWERFTVGENVAAVTVLEVFSPKTQSTSTSYLVAPDCGHSPYWIKHGNIRDRLRKGSSKCPQCVINVGTENCKIASDAIRDRPVLKAKPDQSFSAADLPMDWKPPKMVRTYFQPIPAQVHKPKREPGKCRDGLSCPFDCGYVCRREKLNELETRNGRM